MNRLLVLDENGKMRREEPPSSYRELFQTRKEDFWLDISAPDENDYRILSEDLAFHPLSLEAIRKHEKHRKLDRYDGHLFITLCYAYRSKEDIDTDLLYMFVGRNHLITVHEGALELADMLFSGQEDYEKAHASGVDYLIYSLLDTIMEDYYSLLDDIGERVDEIEDRVLRDMEDGVLDDILALKKRLLRLRRSSSPIRDVVGALIRLHSDFFDEDSRLYLNDLYDHTIHITETLDLHRDMVSSTMEAYLSTISNRLNDTMKVLTSLATIVGALTLVSGIYGMNFRYMPELRWHYGYFAALALMGVMTLVLAYYFRKKKWL